MSTTAHEPGAEGARNISPLWIVLYLPLHQFIAQTVFGNFVFFYLRVAFLALVVVVLLCRRETAQLRDIFIGRWPHGRRDWMIAGGFIVLVCVLRFFESRLFHSGMEPLTALSFIEEAIVPPINEEIVFRGLFLGAMLAYAPRHPWACIVLSTAIFVSCHYLVGSRPPFWTALTVQSLLYGACFVRTRCLPLCMLCHGLWNSILWF